MIMKPDIRIGYLSTMYHTSILIRSMNWLERNGIQPQWTLFGTGPGIVDALMHDELDLGYIGLSPTVIGIGKGATIKCIAGGHVEGTVIIAKPGYQTVDSSKDLAKTLAQFSGKKLGAPRRGSLHDVFLRFYLSECGLSDEVEVLNYEWADFIPDAMLDGEIEGAAGTPPLAVLSSKLLDAKIIVPPSLIWPNNPSYGIVTSLSCLDKRQDLLETFLKVHGEACSQLRTRPNEAASHIAKEIQLVDDQFVLKTLSISPKYCAALSDEFVDSTMRLVPVLRDLNYLATKLEDADIFERRLIRIVHPESPHYT